MDDVSKHRFVKDWKKRSFEMLSYAHPGADPAVINNYLDSVISKELVNPKCEIRNNYVHKRINTALLSVIDWVETTKPICGGYGVFYRNHYEAKNPLSQMIQKFLSSRKKFKSQLRNFPKSSYEYKTFDRKQLSEKIMANSIYGSLGNVISFLFNLYTASSVTATGQSLISTTENAFEAFMTGNVVFNSINECMTYLYNITHEKFKIDPVFLKPVTVNELFKKLTSMFFEYKDVYENTILGYLHDLPQDMINRIYYKNNLYEFSKHHEIQALLYLIVKNTEEFKNPNAIPKTSEKYLNELWSYYEEFVLYNHNLINRIHRLKNDKRKCVLTIDTDSNMLNMNPWVEFMTKYIIKPNMFDKKRDASSLRFISINIMAFVITNMIREVLWNYTKRSNIPKEFRSIINMKNEYLFSTMVLASKKKRYITSVRLREGDEIFPEKIDIKGFDFMKSSATEETKNFFVDVIKRNIIESDGIQISEMLKELKDFESQIIQSLRDGEKKYLTPKSVKEEGGYKDGMALHQQGFRGVAIWNRLYPEMAIELPSKVDVVKVLLDKQSNLDKLKAIDPKIYETIDEQILHCPVEYIRKKGLSIIAIPRNVDKIPDWIIPFIDYDTITIDVLKKFYPVFSSLGIPTIKATAKKEYFSNIVNI